MQEATIREQVLGQLECEVMRRLRSLNASEEGELRTRFAHIPTTVMTQVMKNLAADGMIKRLRAKDGTIFIARSSISPNTMQYAVARFKTAQAKIANNKRRARRRHADLELPGQAFARRAPVADVTRTVKASQESGYGINEHLQAELEVEGVGANAMDPDYSLSYEVALKAEPLDAETKSAYQERHYAPVDKRQLRLSSKNWERVLKQTGTGQGQRNTWRASARQVDYDWMTAIQEDVVRPDASEHTPNPDEPTEEERLNRNIAKNDARHKEEAAMDWAEYNAWYASREADQLARFDAEEQEREHAEQVDREMREYYASQDSQADAELIAYASVRTYNPQPDPDEETPVRYDTKEEAAQALKNFAEEHGMDTSTDRYIWVLKAHGITAD